MIISISKPDCAIKSIINLPASKSISNRILIIRALCKKTFEIKNLSDAEDTKVLKNILLSGRHILDSGAGGTTFRFLTAFLAVRKGEHILTGTERMKQRPVAILVDALRTLGAKIEYVGKEGYPPLKITGINITGKEVFMNGSVSSQYISALLLIAPVLSEGLKLKLTGKISSKPYILMTIKLMNLFGADCKWKDDTIIVAPSGYKPLNFTVEPDWSAASYWYEIAALSDKADITLKGLAPMNIQGDAVVASMFRKFGVKTEFTEDGAQLTRVPFDTKQFVYDFSDCPDLAQTAVVTSAALGVHGTFSGLRSLRIKETDRIAALISELSKFNADAEVTDNETIHLLRGTVSASTSPVCTHNDHRMAMAFAPLALKCDKIQIDDPDVVKKSYPGYWKELERAGFKIKRDLTNP